MYVKLFSSILTSSIWAEDMATRLVWITLLTLADKEGFVRAAPSGVARLANVPLEETQKALQILESPDPDSGSKDDDGRRIEPVDGGWFLLNYRKYREIRTQAQITSARTSKRFRDKQKAANSETCHE